MKKLLLTSGIILTTTMIPTGIVSCSKSYKETPSVPPVEPEMDEISKVKYFIAQNWFLNSVKYTDFEIKFDEETGQINGIDFIKSDSDIFSIIINTSNFGLCKTTNSSLEEKLKFNEKLFGVIDLKEIKWIEYDNPPSPLTRMFIKEFDENQIKNIIDYELNYIGGLKNGKWEEFFSK